MMRVICVWFPDWSIQQLREADAALKTAPVVIHEAGDRRVQRVVVASLEARALGVIPGMRVAKASGLQGITATHLFECDPYADRTALEQLAAWCEQFSPCVGLLGADSLAFDIQSSSRLFGGEASHLETIRQAFRERGLQCRLALADTVGAAWALAQFSRQIMTIVSPGQHTSALEPLPVQALCLEEKTIADLRSLGIERIGQAVELPREELTARFGDHLIKRIDQALGFCPEPIAPYRPAPEASAKWTTESPVDRWEMLEIVLDQLMRRVIEKLSVNTGIVRLRCRLQCEHGPPFSFTIGLVRPTTQRERLLELLRLQWESLRLSAPVSGLQLDVTETDVKATRQNDLFPSATRNDPRALADLVERLSARLGRENVVRPQLVREAQPELAVRYEPLVGAKTSPRRKAVAKLDERLWQRPIHVEHRPIPLRNVTAAFSLGPPAQFQLRGENHRITHTWGPERIETSWWRGRMVRRDYYRVETAEGQWYWLYRRLQDGKWFLHGRFA